VVITVGTSVPEDVVLEKAGKSMTLRWTVAGAARSVTVPR
jgi:hypothetical protein